MYLFCCTTESSDEVLYQNMLQLHPKVLKVPLLDLSTNYSAMQEFTTNINNFTDIIFTSPKSINLCASNVIHSELISAIYFMGAASYELFCNKIDDNQDRVKDYINTRIIRYPQKTSGSLGLIHEVLSAIDFSNKRVLLIKGSYGNIMLEKWLESKQVTFEAINVYNHLKIMFSADYFYSLFTNNKVNGVIVASRLIVNYLFELAIKYNLLEIMQQQKFLTIHPQIVDKLVEFGVNKSLIKLTANANKNDLLKLID